MNLYLFLILASLFNLHANVRIGIISDSGYCGEREVAWRIKIAAESLGWEAFLDEERGHTLRRMKGLDWIVCLIPDIGRLNKRCPNFLTIFHPFTFLNKNGELLPIYEQYDGYLKTIKHTESFETPFKLRHEESYSIPFYPTLQKVEYKKLIFKNLVTMVPVWGNRLIDDKFREFYKLLSQSGFTKFYGINKNSQIIEQGYMGKIPFDGVSVIDAFQQHGIVLIIHSEVHNREGIPSARIFEASAASTVIISDENSFVRERFGDSVLYVDTSKSSEEMYRQIKNHIDFIQLNPETALEMARKAHQIFEDNFLMTDQLLKIQNLNKKIKR